MTTPPLPTVNGTEAYAVSIHWQLGAPEDITYKVYGPAAASLLAGDLPPNNGVLPISLGDGQIDARMLSNGAQLVYDQPGYVSETGKSIGYALQTSAIIHRFTAQQITLSDAFNGTLNGIQIQQQIAAFGPKVGPTTNTIVSMLPDQQGIAFTPVGVTSAQNTTFAFTFVVDSAVMGAILDVDVYEDNLLHATEMISERLGSYVDPQRTSYYLDSGDVGPDGKQVVVIGRKGAASITFDGDVIPVLRMTTAQAQTTDMCASATFVGGDTNHGFPATGKIMDMRVTYDQVMVVGFYGQIDVGGVYFWRGDGAFYPMSQAMGVNWLTENRTGPTLYAATDVGVYSHSSFPWDTVLWKRMGSMCLKCSKVQFADDSKLYALATLNGTSQQHVLIYDGVTNLNLGYDGWASVMTFGGISDFVVFSGWCFTIIKDSPGLIWARNLTTGATQTLILTTGASLIGLDITLGLVFVRTDQGSMELYIINVLGGIPFLQAANTDGSLEDVYGSPIMVNSIRDNFAGHFSCDSNADVPSWYLASTSVGVFSTNDPLGATGWQRTDGQSSIGDFNCTFAGATGVSIYQGQKVQSVFAAADNALYVSNNGSVDWIDMTSLPLDAGPAFWDYFWQQGRAPGPTDTAIPVTYAGVTYLLERILTGVGQWAYRLINPASQAPAGQHRSAEISEISTPALMSEVTASYLLVSAMARFLAYTGRPQIIVEIESFFDDLASPLRTVRPCMAATVSGVPMDYVIQPGGTPFQIGTYAGQFYVLEHTITYDRDTDPTVCTTKTRLGSLLLSDRTDPLRVTADLFYQMSRTQRYRAGKGG